MKVFRPRNHEKIVQLTLRPIAEEDCKTIWLWANETETSDNSFNCEPITWESHVNWFHEKLFDEDYVMYIAMNHEAKAIGLVRFEIEGNEAVISVNIDSEFRGKGYGKELIAQGSHRILYERKTLNKINAYIKFDNKGSERVFTNAGYRMSEPTVINDSVDLLYSTTSL